MVICHCRVVTDRVIRAAIESGARDFADVTRLCGAGGRCGGCVPVVEELLADHGVGVSIADAGRAA